MYMVKLREQTCT